MLCVLSSADSPSARSISSIGKKLESVVESASYQPWYGASHALVVGINRYQNASPLLYAASDAQAVAQILIDKFSFPTSNVTLLLDEQARREAISRAFLKYADSTGPDDRVLIFFAGHGLTEPGRRGEVGYLVPADADIGNRATLIRWDEFRINSEVIKAKHLLFLMDACYGGLLLTRNMIPPGSMRLLKDMLQRYSRQVLSAGKADEPVSDGGGTRPGHSIFTSYLLDGLDGAAAGSHGIVTGQGLMSFVYNKVANDPYSRQTPHFGFLDGDGDFIFDTRRLASLPEPEAGEAVPEMDILIQTPAFPLSPPQQEVASDILKRLLADPKEKVRLEQFILGEVRKAIQALGPESFPMDEPLTEQNFASRLQRYESAINDLQIDFVLLAYWADGQQSKLLEKAFSRLAERDRPSAGLVAWVDLNWYPVLFLLYAAGIAAIAAERYDVLRAILTAPILPDHITTSQRPVPILVPTINRLTEIYNNFKWLPGLERKYVPRSEHLFKKLQPVLEDQLFLGARYESYFDQFEMLLALTFAYERPGGTYGVWGPPGRFAWKEGGFGEDAGVYSQYVAEAKGRGEAWGPIQAGMFGGSAANFAQVADAYKGLLDKIGWY
jgi:hypothetical protein